RRYVRCARDFRDAVEIGADLLPAPAMRRGLELRAADPAARQLAAGLHAGVAEPGPLRRRVRLGAQPDVEFAGLLVEAFHRLAGVDLGAARLLLGDGGHGILR